MLDAHPGHHHSLGGVVLRQECVHLTPGDPINVLGRTQTRQAQGVATVRRLATRRGRRKQVDEFDSWVIPLYFDKSSVAYVFDLRENLLSCQGPFQSDES